MATPRERELAAALRQKEGELEDVRAELEERDALLTKAKSAIEQLSDELDRARREGQVLREELDKVRATWWHGQCMARSHNMVHHALCLCCLPRSTTSVQDRCSTQKTLSRSWTSVSPPVAPRPRNCRYALVASMRSPRRMEDVTVYGAPEWHTRPPTQSTGSTAAGHDTTISQVIAPST